MSDTFLPFADPFFGNGTTEFEPKEGLAAAWFFPKAQAGNTHPGASLPFGMVSACPYSGAYVTGYGTNALNCNGHPPKLFKKNTATGFTHFHQSGPGRIGSYYNYFRVAPGLGENLSSHHRHTLREEQASPGYYAATLHEPSIRVELTVTPCGALHRYTFPSKPYPWLAVDFACGGLHGEGFRLRPTSGEVFLRENLFQGHIVMEDIAIYICGIVQGLQTSPKLFIDSATSPDRSLAFSSNQPPPHSFGVRLRPILDSKSQCTLLLAFSLQNLEGARQNLQTLRNLEFTEARHAAASSWEQSLSRIRVTGDAHQERLFYSALYHSLIKPCHLNGEALFDNTSRPFYADFATLWDQYKTALPLILTLFPEQGADMVNSLLETSEVAGEFPNSILLSRDMARCARQARALTHYVLADARTRHLPDIDWNQALERMLVDLEKPANADFHNTGIAHPFTHTLDLSGASFCTALVALAENHPEIAGKVWPWTSHWRKVYDPQTGILGPSKYYEGGAWNYSFRLLHDMKGRIDLHGGAEPFLRDLKQFFGYGAPPVRQQIDPADRVLMAEGMALNRFEGFNNEPDMETPYAFLYAGSHHYSCEVVRSALRCQFRPGPGGLPGNNDSGALTSAYVWNASGLFPVAGQPVMLIGSPNFESVEFSVPGAKFHVVAKGNSDQNQYVSGASLNGVSIERSYLTMKEFLTGGELVLTMKDQPTGWAASEVPPSFATLEQLKNHPL